MWQASTVPPVRDQLTGGPGNIHTGNREAAMRQSRSSVSPGTSTWRTRPARRFRTRSPWLIGATGVVAVLAAAGLTALSTPAGSSASTFAPRSESGQAVSGQVVPGKPPAGLQQAADHLVADGE